MNSSQIIWSVSLLPPVLSTLLTSSLILHQNVGSSAIFRYYHSISSLAPIIHLKVNAEILIVRYIGHVYVAYFTVTGFHHFAQEVWIRREKREFVEHVGGHWFWGALCWICHTFRFYVLDLWYVWRGPNLQWQPCGSSQYSRSFKVRGVFKTLLSCSLLTSQVLWSNYRFLWMLVWC